jgi:hypothetical protein
MERKTGRLISRNPMQQGILMKKLVITAAALFAITASAHAETYSIEGITIHVGNGCRSSSCVSVYAPGYGSYHGGRPARLHKAHKDTAQVASVARKDDSAATPATTTPATPAAEPVAAATPEAIPQAAPPAASDATPAK